jgi:hypothetical protein
LVRASHRRRLELSVIDFVAVPDGPHQRHAAAALAALLTSLMVLSARGQDVDSQAPPNDEPSELADRIEELERELRSIKEDVKAIEPGSTKTLISGRASVNFTAPEHGDSTFSLKFNPVLLWKLSDELLAGTSFELRVEDDDTEVDLQWANLTFAMNDGIVVRAGLFLTPFSYFQEQLFPAAINRLPDKPLYLAGGGQLAPESSLGVEARGAALFGSTRLTYSAYVSNGPTIRTDGDDAGRFDFRNFTDVNQSKAIGGQIGLAPLPEWEFTYGIQYANVSPDGAGLGDIDVLLHAFAANYQMENEMLGGRLEARAEYVLADFADELDFGSGPFSNDRSGAYAQIAYRPIYAGGFIKDLEGVFRWDMLDQPSGAPHPEDEQRFTFGIDYWIAPTTVVKFAYQIDDVDDPTGRRESSDAVLMQLGMGF